MRIRAAAPLLVSFSFLALTGSAHGATVAAGEAQSCGITAGALTCWGADSSMGALGTGALIDDTATPQPVAGGGAGATDVDYSFTGGGTGTTGCAVINGGVRCWGQGNEGQLGNGTSGNATSATPVAVTGLESGATHVSVSTNHACAVQNGAARCWGNGGFGKLGDDTDEDRLTPVTPLGLGSGVTDIATGRAHTCAIQAGVVMCFGTNQSGALGRDATAQNYNIPVAMEGQPGPAVAISAGTNQTCMANTSGAAYCFGSNANGSLGSGSTETHDQDAQPVSGLGSGVTDLASQVQSNCAVKDGGGFCWGVGTNGQLGNGADANSNVPVAVQGLTGVSSIATGFGHACATASGGQYCWGSNPHFELGTTSVGESAVPVKVSGPAAVPDPAACAKAEKKLEKAKKKLKKLKQNDNVKPKALKKAKKKVKKAKKAKKEACAA